MQNVCIEDNLHEISKPVFWGKKTHKKKKNPKKNKKKQQQQQKQQQHNLYIVY